MGYTAPDASADDAATSRLVQAATMSASALRKTVRPPLPQVELFRPRFGYRTRTLGISDIMNVDEVLKEPRVNYGGTPAGIESSSRNSQGL